MSNFMKFTLASDEIIFIYVSDLNVNDVFYLS